MKDDFQNAAPMTLQEIKAVSFDILKVIARFCEENGIRYTLSSGTLLGAVRHKGFIPWDDDIDIDMPLPDFQRFLRTFNPKEYCPHYEMFFGMKGKKGLLLIQVADMRTVAVSPYRDKHRYLSVWVDIIPVYTCSADEDEAYRQSCRMYDWLQKSRSYLKRPRKRYHPFRWLYMLLTADWWIRHYLKKIYREVERLPYGSTPFVRFPWLQRHPARKAMPARMFEHYEPVCFEGEIFMAVADYDCYLRTTYGDDYMQLPPEEKRIPHPITAYWLPGRKP